MKLFKRIVITALVGIGIGTSGLVTAQGWSGQNRGMGRGYAQQQGLGGPGQTLRSEMHTARIEVLTEMTEQKTETIEAKLKYKPLWTVLDEYKVDYVAFSSKMQEKASEVLKKAVDEGTLNQDQADVMTQRMSQGRGWGWGGHGRRGRGKGFGGGNRGNCPWN
ncbi:MAG: hypothetical protein GY866_27360 [Proteobacteria bacterium]|nr:hypothetical protein [Pseudomonadota bacterium]